MKFGRRWMGMRGCWREEERYQRSDISDQEARGTVIGFQLIVLSEEKQQEQARTKENAEALRTQRFAEGREEKHWSNPRPRHRLRAWGNRREGYPLSVFRFRRRDPKTQVKNRTWGTLREAKNEIRKTTRSAVMVPRSLHCGPQRARASGRDDSGWWCARERRGIGSRRWGRVRDCLGASRGRRGRRCTRGECRGDPGRLVVGPGGRVVCVYRDPFRRGSDR